MATLGTCIKRAGKALSKDDADQIIAIRDELEGGGLDSKAAAIQAVTEYLETLRGEAIDLGSRVAGKGGDIGPLFQELGVGEYVKPEELPVSEPKNVQNLQKKSPAAPETRGSQQKAQILGFFSKPPTAEDIDEQVKQRAKDALETLAAEGVEPERAKYLTAAWEKGANTGSADKEMGEQPRTEAQMLETGNIIPPDDEGHFMLGYAFGYEGAAKQAPKPFVRAPTERVLPESLTAPTGSAMEIGRLAKALGLVLTTKSENVARIKQVGQLIGQIDKAGIDEIDPTDIQPEDRPVLHGLVDALKKLETRAPFAPGTSAYEWLSAAKAWRGRMLNAAAAPAEQPAPELFDVPAAEREAQALKNRETTRLVEDGTPLAMATNMGEAYYRGYMTGARDAFLGERDDTPALPDELRNFVTQYKLAYQLGWNAQRGLSEKSANIALLPTAADAYATGQPVSGNGYRAIDAENIYAGANVPIMGQGLYVSITEAGAKDFSDNVEEVPIEFNNPLVIRSDDEWKSLTKNVGWTVPNPAGMGKAYITAMTNRLQEHVRAMGHDGIVAVWDNETPTDQDKYGNWVKTLRNVLGAPQIIAFPKTAAAGGTLSDAIAAQFDEIKNNNDLKRIIAETQGIKPAMVPASQIKAAQEIYEGLLAEKARARVARGGTDEEIYRDLVLMYLAQPLLNVRSSTSMENQAYSTPAPIAFLANRLTGMSRNAELQFVYEPTAGNGMLLLDINSEKRHIRVNELDPTRAAELRRQGFRVTEDDASKPLSITGGDDVVIANPPFGKMRDADGRIQTVSVNRYKLSSIDHLIAARSLESMRDSGRAVLILGANMEASKVGGGERTFLNWLYSHYNVVSHFEVDGKLYQRQGAGWPIRMITIAGRRAVHDASIVAPTGDTIDRVTTWDALYEKANLDTLGRVGRDQGAVDPVVLPPAEGRGNAPAEPGGPAAGPNEGEPQRRPGRTRGGETAPPVSGGGKSAQGGDATGAVGTGEQPVVGRGGNVGSKPGRVPAG
ncbi:MAG: hypothetical protein E4H01_06010, partial [Lysobacterales bacterium]